MYIDIILLLNGGLDAFLVIVTAYILKKKLLPANFVVGILIGEFSLAFEFVELNFLVNLVGKIIVGLLMIAVSFKIKRVGELIKTFFCYNFTAALLGGIVYILFEFLGMNAKTSNLQITLQNIFILPVSALLLLIGYLFWNKIQQKNLVYDSVLYDLEVQFEENNSIEVKALLDTGNELRDPLTMRPVIIMEESAVFNVLPEEIKTLLMQPWDKTDNPWQFLWKLENKYASKIVFIAARGINGKSWFPGIHFKVKVKKDDYYWEGTVTIALVRIVLNAEGRFRALLNLEHINSKIVREEIAS
ncbi:MAG: sigma-E processing peptidase SpoIIGA [Eubacteriales bacterium]